MSKQDFLSNLRVARNLFLHPHVEADSPQIDSQAVQQKLARAAIWLTPRSVNGFNASDFSELGLERQRQLQAAVRDFLEVANKVPANKPATTEQYANAAAAFARMLEILDPYLGTPEEGKIVAKALQSIEFPPWVVNWDYELGNDEDGSPVVWVNLYADETAASPKEYARLASQLTQTIWQVLSGTDVRRWPYIRVRTALEHKST